MPEIGPFYFDEQLDKDGDLEFQIENLNAELESFWFTRDTAEQTIDYLIRLFPSLPFARLRWP